MFSFAGKLNRRQFFLQSLLNFIIFCVFVTLPAYVSNKGIERESSFLVILGGVLSLALIVISIALTVRQTALLTRRLRHIGWNTDFAVYITILFGVIGAMSLSEALNAVAGIIFIILFISYFVFFFIPGKYKEVEKNGKAKPHIDVHSESTSDGAKNTDTK